MWSVDTFINTWEPKVITSMLSGERSGHVLAFIGLIERVMKTVEVILLCCYIAWLADAEVVYSM